MKISLPSSVAKDGHGFVAYPVKGKDKPSRVFVAVKITALKALKKSKNRSLQALARQVEAA